jgi:hypothetical protein
MVRHRLTLSAIAGVTIAGSVAFLGCNPAGDRTRFDRSISSPLSPTAFDVGATDIATSVSWACLTNGVDRHEFVASGWTIHRDPCPSMSAARVTSAAVAAPVFAPAPENLRASIVGDTLQLDWDQPPSASAWQLEAGTAPGLSNVAVFRTTVRRLTVTNVPGGTHYVRVRSAPSDYSDLSVPSNEIALRFGVRGCGAVAPPTDFAALVVGNEVLLSWKTPGSGTPASYVLVVGSAPGRRDLVVFDTGGPVTSLRATAPNGVYYAYILSRTPCGETTSTEESRQLIITVPSQSASPLPPPPVAEFTFGRYARGQQCSIHCLFDAWQSTGTGLTYFWDFADGSIGSGILVQHEYARPAALREMTVVLTVSDAFGRTSTKARAVYIGPDY